MHGIIPQLFHCWADPVVHLLLLKSSMGQFNGYDSCDPPKSYNQGTQNEQDVRSQYCVVTGVIALAQGSARSTQVLWFDDFGQFTVQIIDISQTTHIALHAVPSFVHNRLTLFAVADDITKCCKQGWVNERSISLVVYSSNTFLPTY